MSYLKDENLGYDRIRWSYEPGSELLLDPIYRYAHLPLVNLAHPEIIRSHEDYRLGRYETKRYSLVISFPFEELEASESFRRVDAAMRSASFSPKIAWDVMNERRAKLHATVCGGLVADEVEALLQRAAEYLSRTGPIRLRLGGPIVGEKNRGRAYFPVYPEDREGNPIQALQAALDKQITNIYLLGYYNFRDHLVVNEATDLSAILAIFKDVTILEQAISELVAFETQDDLVLSGREIGRSSRWSLPCLAER